MTRKSLWIALPLSLVLGGCLHGGATGYERQPVAEIEPVKLSTGQDANLIPLDKGSIWNYSFESEQESNGKVGQGQGAILTYQVTESETANNSTHATFELLQEKTVIERQRWIEDTTGVYQVSVGPKETAFSTPQPVMMFPVKDHQTFEWRGTGICPDGNWGQIVAKSKVLGSQDVDTDVGRISAIAVETNVTFTVSGKAGSAISTTWFKPGVGIVRFKQETLGDKIKTISILRLKNYSLKSK